MKDLLVGCWLALLTSRPFLYVYTWLRPYPDARAIVDAFRRSGDQLMRAALGKGVGPVE